MLHSCNYNYSCRHSQSSRELRNEHIHNHISAPTPCKLLFLQSPSEARVFIGFNQFRHCNFTRTKSIYGDPNRICLRFKLQCHLKTVSLPAKGSAFNGKKKNGGVLPSILRSLDFDSNFEETLNSTCQNLNPKEQTVVLKSQRNWGKVVRVFEFFKSREDYVPNVIHYNIVLRALGRAQKWDELRRYWIEMAKNGVLPTNNTYSMLVDVYGKAGLAKESLLWIKHMRNRGLYPDEVTMSTVVKVLKDAGEFDRAHRFYESWRTGQIQMDDIEFDDLSDLKNSSIKHFLSTELFRVGGRTPPGVLESLDSENVAQKPYLTSTYNTLIDLYGKAGRLDDAANVFSDMMKFGVAMDTITFNTMIFICGKHGLFSEAEALLSKMEERGISPNTRTYNTFLSLYADSGNIDAAIECYRKIKEVGLFPDIVSHRAILHELCERSMVKDVEVIIEEMDKSSQRIDEHSLPGIVKMYVTNGILDKAKDFVEKYELDCGGFSSKTRAAIMDVYAEKALWEEAEAVFRKRLLAGQRRDILEYNVMIKAYGKGKRYDEAFDLFKSMRNRGIWPDECTYNSIIQMFSRADLVDRAIELLAEMHGAGFRPQCLTYSSLIASYARLGQLLDAVGIYEEMVKVGVKPNKVVYGALINGFADAGELENALKYLHTMEESGIPANQIVLTSLIKAYSKVGCYDSAKSLYQKMKGFKGGPDIVASTSMISLCADLGLVSEAESLFNNLKENGSADEVSYATMMSLYRDMCMFDEAIDVAEEMKQSGLLRDTASYNKVMGCYAVNGLLIECASLLYEMIVRKLSPNSGTFKVLFPVLKKGGFPTEAIAQLKSSYLEGKPYAQQAVITAVFSVVGLHELALKACEIFVKANAPLDSFTYNVAIYAYESSGDIDRALNVFMKMRDKGLEPDVVTCINLVRCYGKAGLIEGVERTYSQLKCGEIEQSESLLKAIVDAYKKANRRDLADMVNREMRLGFDSLQLSDSDSGEYSDFDGSDGFDRDV